LTSLSDIGLQIGVLVESIVSTYSGDTPHAAAMGCMTPDGFTLVIRPFTNTQTFRNLLDRRSLVVNITHDPSLFYRVVFGEPVEFEESRFVDAPVVKEAVAWVEAVSLESKPLSSERVEVLCQVKHVEARLARPLPYSRAEHALMESLIHYTRVKVFKQAGMQQEASKLVEKIKDYERLIRRVSTNPSHLAMVARVVEEIGKLGYDCRG